MTATQKAYNLFSQAARLRAQAAALSDDPFAKRHCEELIEAADELEMEAELERDED